MHQWEVAVETGLMYDMCLGCRNRLTDWYLDEFGCTVDCKRCNGSGRVEIEKPEGGYEGRTIRRKVRCPDCTPPWLMEYTDSEL